MPLSFANIGDTNTISQVGGRAETKKHLENLGVVSGSTVSVVSVVAGNRIFKVSVARLAISN